jgi:hypothetical protein
MTLSSSSRDNIFTLCNNSESISTNCDTVPESTRAAITVDASDKEGPHRRQQPRRKSWFCGITTLIQASKRQRYVPQVHSSEEEGEQEAEEEEELCTSRIFARSFPSSMEQFMVGVIGFVPKFY